MVASKESMTRMLLTSTAAAALVTAMWTGAPTASATSYAADNPPGCADVNQCAVDVNLPGADASADAAGVDANVPGANANAGPG